MRDILVVGLVVIGLLATLRRPWVGIMVWTWLSLMNPHRYCFGFAYAAPLAATTAGVTLVALLATKDRESPFKGTPVTAFALFTLWVTISWALGFDPSGDYEQWKKIMKINLMILVALALLRTKEQIFALVWVSALSLAVLGAKGGIFTILGGGSQRVWGPPGSFIEGNNEFALALVMMIPLLRFLQMQLAGRWSRHGMTALMVLCAAAALGSQSRGALLGISAMAVLLWWRGRSRIVGGVVIILAAVSLLSLMPESWDARMGTIGAYEQDGSAMGRISAWWTAWGVAKDNFFGGGFNPGLPEMFLKYSPYGLDHKAQAAHSIYFQVLGNHGFVGFMLFVAVWFSTWRSAAWMRKHAAQIPQARWCAELGAMCQVSLVGYLVGGAFLSLAYFDLPYDIVALVVLARAWCAKKAWETEAAPAGRWIVPGLVGHASRA
jgi:probable O-glycosylation ligase (exosortase A-associated)